MQKQFEEWAALIGINIAFDSNYQMYTDERTELDWATWQASRAAIVVKMPKYHSFDFDYSALYDSLDAAGVSYE